MQDKVRKLLVDISTAIQYIEEFSSDKKSFSDYQVDLKTKSAVERQLAVIGEATNKIIQLNFRNRLIHAYDSIDDTIVWAILKTHLPVLKAEVQNLLR
jgi:uncharacterized protein with HEPN domain